MTDWHKPSTSRSPLPLSHRGKCLCAGNKCRRRLLCLHFVTWCDYSQMRPPIPFTTYHPPTYPHHTLFAVLPQFITQPSFACFWGHFDTLINSSLKQLFSLNLYLYRAKCTKCPGKVTFLSSWKVLSATSDKISTFLAFSFTIGNLDMILFLLLDRVTAMTEQSNNFKANYVNWRQVLCAWHVQLWSKVFVHLQRTCISWQLWVPLISTSLLFLWRNEWNIHEVIIALLKCGQICPVKNIHTVILISGQMSLCHFNVS